MAAEAPATAGAASGADGINGEQPIAGIDEFGPYRTQRIWSMNEIRDHPLFMEDVPRDIEDNPHLLALQSLIYEDKTQEEVVDHFKNLGNEALKSSNNKVSLQNALLCYTRGLEEECDDKCLKSQLHSNRALVSYRMKEYDKAVNDCRSALQLDPRNMKAYWRATQASEALLLTAQALAFCNEALKISPEENESLKVRNRLQKVLEHENQERDRARQAADRAAKEKSGADSVVQAVLQSRGVRIGPCLFDMSMYTPKGAPRPVLASDDDSAVVWPLLFMYDETSQSDFVESFDERCTLSDQLQIMFPADRQVEWDVEGKYVWDRLAAYLEYYPDGHRDTRVKRVDTSDPLANVLKDLCLPPCLSLHMMANGSPFHRNYCQSHDLSP